MMPLDHVGDGLRPVAEINVTPFIDVVLVLLIVFMIAAPLAMAEVPLKLPRSDARPARQPATPVVVSLTGDGRLFLDAEEIAADAIGERVGQLLAGDPERLFQVRADQGIAYGEVVGLLGRLGQAGVSRLALLSQPAAGVRP